MTETFVVLDQETSGFHPLKDRVLEVGALHIDMKTLEVLGRFQTVAGCSQAKLDELDMDAFVLNMHTENGLFAEVVESAVCGSFEADMKLSRWFDEIGAGLRDIILCGNSIHFDRGFMEVQLYQSFKFLSHRVVDTSSLLTCYKQWIGVDKRHTSAHRAIADCEASLEVLRWAREIFRHGAPILTPEAALR